jgi:disulfide bond formation protein DsbB
MGCAIITLFVATAISAYHSGVEHGLFGASSQCNPAMKITDDMTNDEVLLALGNQPVATCTVAPFKILMLSMAEWNLLLNLGLLILVSVNYNRRFRAKT